jgi:hypothetical protein
MGPRPIHPRSNVIVTQYAELNSEHVVKLCATRGNIYEVAFYDSKHGPMYSLSLEKPHLNLRK